MFSYDKIKSASNKDKHGIDFEEAQALWEDAEAVRFTASTTAEIRFALIACLWGKLWTAFYTPRDGNIRLISVRRARKKEEELYYENLST